MSNFLLSINKILGNGMDVPIGWCEDYDTMPTEDDVDSIRARFEELMDMQHGSGSFVLRVEGPFKTGSQLHFEQHFTVEAEIEEPESEFEDEEDDLDGDPLGLDDYYRFCRGE